jgi:hypothetical protein
MFFPDFIRKQAMPLKLKTFLIFAVIAFCQVDLAFSGQQFDDALCFYQEIILTRPDTDFLSTGRFDHTFVYCSIQDNICKYLSRLYWRYTILNKCLG